MYGSKLNKLSSICAVIVSPHLNCVHDRASEEDRCVVQHPPLCTATIQYENIVWIKEGGLAFLCVQQVIRLLWGNVTSLYICCFWKSWDQHLFWLTHCQQVEKWQGVQGLCVELYLHVLLLVKPKWLKKKKTVSLPLFPIGIMEEWSLSVLPTSLSQMLLTICDVLTGSLEATLQLLLTLTKTHTEVQMQHYDSSVHSFWFLLLKKRKKAFTWTVLRPSRLSHLTDASAVSTSPSLKEHATPRNRENVKTSKRYFLIRPTGSNKKKQQEISHHAQFVLAVILTQFCLSLALNLAGGLGNSVMAKCSQRSHSSWLWQVMEERPE